MKRFLLAICCVPFLASAEIRYTISPEPNEGSLRVSMTLEPTSEQTVVRIPAWTPGFYFLQDYQKKLSDLKATDGRGALLTIHREGDRSWRIDTPGDGPVTVSYRVLGDDRGLGFFGVHVRSSSAFVNGPAAFLYVDGRLEEQTRLAIRLPGGWQIATAMDRSSDGSYVAGGYDELVDHPIQMGRFIRRSFTVKEIPFDVVFVPGGMAINCDVDHETERLRKLSRPALDMMGDAPFKRYLYIIHLQVGDFNGGLEHRASNVMAVSNASTLGIDALAAHEFFHAWNVKQIRPAVLGPFDYQTEVRTTNLWFSEGVTDYYAQLHVRQSGLEGDRWLMDALSYQVSVYESGSMRRKITLEEASLRAWENGGFGVGDLSYYNKGLVTGLLFDAAIRAATKGARSLDDVIRVLYARNRLPKPGFAENELSEVINEVAGVDLTALYNQLVRSTSELPYGLLKGIGLRMRAADGGIIEFDPQASAEAKARRAEWLRGSNAGSQ